MRTLFITRLLRPARALRGVCRRQSSDDIAQAIERYNAEYAFASARRFVAFVGFSGAVVVPLLAAKVVFAGICIITTWSLALVRRPVDLLRDPGARLIPDELLGIFAEPGALDSTTRAWLSAEARTHAGVPVRILRAEWLRRKPGFVALTEQPWAAAADDEIPPSSDPKTTIDLHGMLQQQCRAVDKPDTGSC